MGVQRGAAAAEGILYWSGRCNLHTALECIPKGGSNQRHIGWCKFVPFWEWTLLSADFQLDHMSQVVLKMDMYLLYLNQIRILYIHLCLHRVNWSPSWALQVKPWRLSSSFWMTRQSHNRVTTQKSIIWFWHWLVLLPVRGLSLVLLLVQSNQIITYLYCILPSQECKKLTFHLFIGFRYSCCVLWTGLLILFCPHPVEYFVAAAASNETRSVSKTQSVCYNFYVLKNTWHMTYGCYT